jgi:TonB family protein
MRFIKISMTSLELARAPVNRPVIVIGRSPGCDVILRAKGVRPVHFVVEWIGDGEFKPGTGPWSIIEFGQAPMQSRSDMLNAATGEGVLLAETAVTFGGFRFEWVQDRLAETDLPGGHLLDDLMGGENKTLTARLAAGVIPVVLESIIVRHESNAVVDVDHLNMRQNRRYTISQSPLVQIAMSGPKVMVVLERAAKTQVYRRGERVEPNFLNGRNTVEMGFADVMQLRNEVEDMLLRFVPPVDIEMPVRDLKTDQLLRWGIVGAVIVLVLAVVLHNLPPMKPEPPPKTPRFARVEIRDNHFQAPSSTPAAAAPTAAPTPAAAPAAKPEVVQKQSAPMAPRPSQVKAQARAKKTTRAADPMDLLNALQDRTGVGGNRLDVNELVSSGAGPQAATEAGSGIIVRQPPPGLRQSEFRNVTGAQGNLSKVSNENDVESNVDESFQVDSFDDSGRARKLKSDFDGGGLAGFGGDVDNNTVSGDGIESIKGGLSRVSVKKSLTAVREDITACYNKALLTNSKLKGMAVFRWHISPQGSVTSIQLVRSDFRFPMLEDCVRRVIQGIAFEAAKTAIPTTVVYPFKFRKSN